MTTRDPHLNFRSQAEQVIKSFDFGPLEARYQSLRRRRAQPPSHPSESIQPLACHKNESQRSAKMRELRRTYAYVAQIGAGHRTLA